MRSAFERAVRTSHPWPLHVLFAELAQAARNDDRAGFDRLFDCCFEWVYAVAWRVTRDRARAQAITEEVLSQAMAEAP
jgi:DNA-directed RNA polymerase specialized sigma24 family protein